MFRWTIEELKETSDINFIEQVLNERIGRLTNHYSPLNKKLKSALRLADMLTGIADDKDEALNLSDIKRIYKRLNNKEF